MGKERSKEEINFNPSDYDYLNKIPLEGWMWEFIRRNREYRRLYSEIKKPQSKRDPFYGKHFDFFLRYFGMEATRDVDPSTPLSKEHFLTSQLPGLLKKIKTKHSRSRRVTEGFPNPDIKYNEFTEQYKPIILKGAIVKALIPPSIYKASHWGINDPYQMPEHWINKDKQLSHTGLDMYHGDENFNYICVYAMTSALEVYEMEDTIYLGISKYAELPDVKKKLGEIYKKYILHGASIRERRKEWYIYLIAYDLIEKYKEKDIANLLYPNEPNNYPDFSVSKKIRKHIQEAERLINERQYLKFLSLTISKEFRK